ncbi:MAG: DJ-1/PfpI family protein [Bacteroidales bacterium]
MKKILLIAGDFSESLEVFFPYQALNMSGFKVISVAPHKKKGDFVTTAVHDFEREDTYTEKRGHKFLINTTLETIDVKEFDGLVLPGGRAPEYLRLDQRILDISKHFIDNNKPIACICHGMQILTAANLIKDRKVTSHPAIGPDIRLAGGKYVSVDINDIVVDKNIVSAPAWPANPKWMAAFIKLLNKK